MTAADWAKLFRKYPRSPADVQVWSDWLEEQGKPPVVVTAAKLQAQFWRVVAAEGWMPHRYRLPYHKKQQLYGWLDGSRIKMMDKAYVDTLYEHWPTTCRLPDYLFRPLYDIVQQVAPGTLLTSGVSFSVTTPGRVWATLHASWCMLVTRTQFDLTTRPVEKRKKGAADGEAT